VLLLLGAGVFLTTVVVGAVSLCGSFHLMERPFLRDLIFYIAVVFFTFYMLNDNEISLVESCGTLTLQLYYCQVIHSAPTTTMCGPLVHYIVIH